MERLSDTSPEAERVLVEVFRRMSPADRWLRVGQLFEEGRFLQSLGRPHGEAMSLHQPSIIDTRSVITVLDRLGIVYAIGGSIASSIYGIDRFTRDADLTVEPFPGKESELAACFGEDFYISLTAIRDANQRHACFNIINTVSGFKIDCFVRKDEPFEESALARRRSFDFPDQPGQPVFVHSPEDVILFKLRWYRLGNESLEQQIRDIVGVLRVQAGRLDHAYLDRWAAELKVADLLDRVRREAGLP